MSDKKKDDPSPIGSLLLQLIQKRLDLQEERIAAVERSQVQMATIVDGLLSDLTKVASDLQTILTALDSIASPAQVNQVQGAVNVVKQDIANLKAKLGLA